MVTDKGGGGGGAAVVTIIAIGGGDGAATGDVGGEGEKRPVASTTTIGTVDGTTRGKSESSSSIAAATSSSVASCTTADTAIATFDRSSSSAATAAGESPGFAVVVHVSASTASALHDDARVARCTMTAVAGGPTATDFFFIEPAGTRVRGATATVSPATRAVPHIIAARTRPTAAGNRGKRFCFSRCLCARENNRFARVHRAFPNGKTFGFFLRVCVKIKFKKQK